MAKLINSTSMTIDGVTDVSDWFVGEGTHDDAGFAIFRSCDAMLLGRTTFDGLAGFWPTAEGPWAEAINPLPKWVISRSTSGPQPWNGTAVAGDAAETVAKIKADSDGTLFMSGCGELARALFDGGLIDELHLWVHPSLVGTGTRAFEQTELPMQLLAAEAFDTGVTHQIYVPLR